MTFELYINGELFKEFMPENQEDFWYNENETAYENKARIQRCIDYARAFIKYQNKDAIELNGNFEIFYIPDQFEK